MTPEQTLIVFLSRAILVDAAVRGLVLGLQENRLNATMNTSSLKSVSPLHNRLYMLFLMINHLCKLLIYIYARRFLFVLRHYAMYPSDCEMLQPQTIHQIYHRYSCGF